MENIEKSSELTSLLCEATVSRAHRAIDSDLEVALRFLALSSVVRPSQVAGVMEK